MFGTRTPAVVSMGLLFFIAIVATSLAMAGVAAKRDEIVTTATNPPLPRHTHLRPEFVHKAG